MNGKEGTYEFWHQGFVCTILDQVYSSVGKRFDDYYPNTVTCEVMRNHARKYDLLVTHEQLVKKQYIPQEGKIILYISENQEAHHTEIIYEILDLEQGIIWW